jgi:NADH dehydrogenase FAD-containing subunit
VARLGLHASVSTVDSHLVALDAQQQLLMLADGGHLPYDLLAVTTGLQVCRCVAQEAAPLPLV